MLLELIGEKTGQVALRYEVFNRLNAHVGR